MTAYLLLKALHIFCFAAWLAGMVFLCWLYGDHAGVACGGEADLLLQRQEQRLLRRVVTPAMILTLILGLSLVVQDMAVMKQGWLHAKLGLVLVLAGCHGLLARTRKDFAQGRNNHGPGFYQRCALVLVVLLVTIVWLAVAKPF